MGENWGFYCMMPEYHWILTDLQVLEQIITENLQGMAFHDHFEIILQSVPFFFLGLQLTYLPNPWSDFGILRPPWLLLPRAGAQIPYRGELVFSLTICLEKDIGVPEITLRFQIPSPSCGEPCRCNTESACQSQVQRKQEWERQRGGKLGNTPGTQCLCVHKNKCVYLGPGVWAFLFLSLPHPELLCSSLTTHNERSTPSKCSWYCHEQQYNICSWHGKWKARYLLSKLMAWISGRSTSTSTMAIGRHLTGSFPLCQIWVIGSQGIQKLLPDSRGIFSPTQMIQLRIESSSCCTVWGVLERLKFA